VLDFVTATREVLREAGNSHPRIDTPTAGGQAPQWPTDPLALGGGTESTGGRQARAVTALSARRAGSSR
jgi:hypothetical protein